MISLEKDCEINAFEAVCSGSGDITVSNWVDSSTPSKIAQVFTAN